MEMNAQQRDRCDAGCNVPCQPYAFSTRRAIATFFAQRRCERDSTEQKRPLACQNNAFVISLVGDSAQSGGRAHGEDLGSRLGAILFHPGGVVRPQPPFEPRAQAAPKRRAESMEGTSILEVSTALGAQSHATRPSADLPRDGAIAPWVERSPSGSGVLRRPSRANSRRLGRHSRADSLPLVRRCDARSRSLVRRCDADSLEPVSTFPADSRQLAQLITSSTIRSLRETATIEAGVGVCVSPSLSG